MDLNKKVTVLTPNGRRQNIKITPSTTLLQILEEACQKHGFPSDEYGLKSHNKELDLLQMFRFTGLPNNCLLEMFECPKKRVESMAEICVQLEDGSRFQGQLVPGASLYDVLLEICPAYLESDKSPVFIYMRKEIFGDELKKTTLKALGITGGRTMMRLVDKNPDDIKTQAGVYVPPVVKETPKDPKDDSKRANKQPSRGFAITSQLVQSLKNKDQPQSSEAPQGEPSSAMDTAETPNQIDKPKVQYDWGTGSGRTINSKIAAEQEDESNRDDMEEEPEVNVIGERNAVIYSLDSTQKQIEDLPDSFYDLTVNDLKLVLRDLKKVVEGSEDSPLLTAKLRELEESKVMLRKIAQYKNCIIRVQFPDRHVLQGIFKPIEKIEDVVSFVRGFLINKDLDFHLFTIPPKVLMPLDKTLLEVDCVPNAVLHFGVNEHDALPSILPYVQKQFLQKLTSPEGAFYIASKSRLIRGPVTDENDNNNCRASCSAPGPSTGAIPKRPRNDHFRPSAAMDQGSSSDVPKWFMQPNK